MIVAGQDAGGSARGDQGGGDADGLGGCGDTYGVERVGLERHERDGVDLRVERACRAHAADGTICPPMLNFRIWK